MIILVQGAIGQLGNEMRIYGRNYSRMNVFPSKVKRHTYSVPDKTKVKESFGSRFFIGLNYCMFVLIN